jgi:hypothetical protein
MGFRLLAAVWTRHLRQLRKHLGREKGKEGGREGGKEG